MKHICRAAILTILLLITVFCLSAPAWANVWTPKSLKEIGDEAFMGVPMQKKLCGPNRYRNDRLPGLCGYWCETGMAAENAQLYRTGCFRQGHCFYLLSKHLR